MEIDHLQKRQYFRISDFMRSVFWKSASAISGAFGLLATDLFHHPLDTLKTRIQMRLPIKNGYTSLGEMKSMFSGMSTNLIGLPCGFIYFSVYDIGNYVFEPFFEKYTTSSICHFLTGGIAEVATIILRNPFEVIKQQMQCGLDSRVISTFKAIHKIRGFQGSLI